VYVWGDLDVWIGKHNLWNISLFIYFYLQLYVYALSVLHEQLNYLWNILSNCLLWCGSGKF
jgi:hypothetical protein